MFVERGTGGMQGGERRLWFLPPGISLRHSLHVHLSFFSFFFLYLALLVKKQM